ncbi:L-aspartate oxidase [candidate division KSB1 bacterium]|nr:L-aspartate oxidase [candidate division KSB1 bacterium]
MKDTLQADVLIVGSGIAGLSLALKLSQVADVILVTKKQSAESATNWAQGGIAAVTAQDDDIQLHVEDTLRAGAGLCHEDAVRLVVETAPTRIRELMELGVRFSRHEGELSLGREGGHSRSRILHHRDRTGMEIESVLLRRARKSGRLRVLEHHLMIDLLIDPHPRAGELARTPRCYGAYVLETRKNFVKTITARAVVLATGGSGTVYEHTTNPTIATGDGVVAAWRAGARVGNLEFMQFHPTTLYQPGSDDKPRELITEALRGHGALLKNLDGERFMLKYDERGELAPRDIVARAIDAEMKKRGERYVLLDASHLDAPGLRREFPHIDTICRGHNIDFTADPIPVVPAAHYQCGGVVTDLRARTSIPGLFAIGEVAMTGVHGANRLASNSLLEAVVFADQAAASCGEWLRECPPAPEAQSWSEEGTVNSEEWILVQHDRNEIRKLMWDYVGIVRSTLRLQRARRRLDLLVDEVTDFYRRTRISAPLVELRNLAIMADLIVSCAQSRSESRGLHFMSDRPNSAAQSPPQDTVKSLYPALLSLVSDQ